MKKIIFLFFFLVWISTVHWYSGEIDLWWYWLVNKNSTIVRCYNWQTVNFNGLNYWRNSQNSNVYTTSLSWQDSNNINLSANIEFPNHWIYFQWTAYQQSSWGGYIIIIKKSDCSVTLANSAYPVSNTQVKGYIGVYWYWESTYVIRRYFGNFNNFFRFNDNTGVLTNDSTNNIIGYNNFLFSSDYNWWQKVWCKNWGCVWLESAGSNLYNLTLLTANTNQKIILWTVTLFWTVRASINRDYNSQLSNPPYYVSIIQDYNWIKYGGSFIFNKWVLSQLTDNGNPWIFINQSYSWSVLFLTWSSTTIINWSWTLLWNETPLWYGFQGRNLINSYYFYRTNNFFYVPYNQLTQSDIWYTPSVPWQTSWTWFTQNSFFKRCSFLKSNAYNDKCLGANTDYYWSTIYANFFKENTWVGFTGNTNTVLSLLEANYLWIYGNRPVYNEGNTRAMFSSGGLFTDLFASQWTWTYLLGLILDTGTQRYAVDVKAYKITNTWIVYNPSGNDVNVDVWSQINFDCDTDKNSDIGIGEWLYCPIIIFKWIVASIGNWLTNIYELSTKLRELSPDLSFDFVPQAHAGTGEVNTLMETMSNKSPILFPSMWIWKNIILYWIIFILILIWFTYILSIKKD